MNDIKPWQIILIVVAIAVVAFSGWKMTRGGVVEGPSGHMTVDVMTGQLYLVQKGKAKGVMYPAKHPDTGERTLFPVNKNEESGLWEFHRRTTADTLDEFRDRSTALSGGVRIKVLDSKPIVHVIMK